eukprot:c26191_g1_i1 orf=787-969(-)
MTNMVHTQYLALIPEQFQLGQIACPGLFFEMKMSTIHCSKLPPGSSWNDIQCTSWQLKCN